MVSVSLPVCAFVFTFNEITCCNHNHIMLYFSGIFYFRQKKKYISKNQLSRFLLFEVLQFLFGLLNNRDGVRANPLSLLQVADHFFISKTFLKNFFLLLSVLALALFLNLPQQRGLIALSTGQEVQGPVHQHHDVGLGDLVHQGLVHNLHVLLPAQGWGYRHQVPSQDQVWRNRQLSPVNITLLT